MFFLPHIPGDVVDNGAWIVPLIAPEPCLPKSRGSGQSPVCDSNFPLSAKI